MAAPDRKENRPYGLWSSPITAGTLGNRVRLQDVHWSRNGKTLVWVEGRGKTGVLVASSLSDAPRVLSEGFNVRGGIGYGGGEFTTTQNDVVFTDQAGGLYRTPFKSGLAQSLIPSFGACASPSVSPDERWVLFVFSDGKRDLLGLTASEPGSWPFQLAQGADFYLQPAWHPSSEWISWVEWDHPNMPWHGSRVMMAHLSGGTPPRVEELHPMAGDENTPASQPLFSPDGRWLSMLVGNGEWDDLVLMDMASGKKRTLVRGEGFHLCKPPWVQGEHTYGWSGTSKKIIYTRYAEGTASLWIVDLENDVSLPLEIPPYNWIDQLSVNPVNDHLAFIGSGPVTPQRLVHWGPRGMQVVARSENEGIPTENLSVPQPISWKATDGTTVYGIYYPPANPGYIAKGLPPAVVSIHGGPSSGKPANYSPEACFYTSRGYAYLEVNYRGSSGYGYRYLNLLNRHWGEFDSEDAAGAAEALAAKRLADPHRLAIKGGSAGGYTVLNTLIRFPHVYKAGICEYGVSNLFTIAMETHKFEAHYTDRLVGVLPREAKRYHELSPVFHAEKIQDAMLIFQGDEDTAVPVAQSNELVAALQRNHVPVQYKVYQGEGHGFRKPETLEDYYKTVERFLRETLVFSA